MTSGHFNEEVGNSNCTSTIKRPKAPILKPLPYPNYSMPFLALPPSAAFSYTCEVMSEKPIRRIIEKASKELRTRT